MSPFIAKMRNSRMNGTSAGKLTAHFSGPNGLRVLSSNFSRLGSRFSFTTRKTSTRFNAFSIAAARNGARRK
jgi:hypothetical protein